jgi:hypothetical protein
MQTLNQATKTAIIRTLKIKMMSKSSLIERLNQVRTTVIKKTTTKSSTMKMKNQTSMSWKMEKKIKSEKSLEPKF